MLDLLYLAVEEYIVNLHEQKSSLKLEIIELIYNLSTKQAINSPT